MILAHPEPAGMGDFTAERRDFAFDDEPGVGRARSAKP